LLNYGTSGFRDNAKYLKFVGWRVGLFVGMMSRNSKEKLGVMITASHNKIIDNGFKIVPPKGGMLSMEDEKHIE
jgi:phosphoacetylglucosamine mutase